MNITSLQVPVFKDRIEKKFRLGVKGSEVTDLWRELKLILAPYEMHPVQEITSVGSALGHATSERDTRRAFEKIRPASDPLRDA